MIHRIALLGLLSAGLLHAETFRDAYAQTHPLDAHGMIRIDNTNGAIVIKTWDRPEVSVEVEKRASSEDYLKEIDVAIDSDPHSLSIKTRFPSHPLSWLRNWGGNQAEVHLVLMVPASVDLNDITLVNGSITIDGVHGAIDVHTINGGIHATGVGDHADLSTVNGTIHAEVTALGSSGHLHLSTINGSISVLLAKDAGATFRASTVNGSTSCEFPIRLTESSHRRGMNGVIGAGGGSIVATTVNGSVHLQSL